MPVLATARRMSAPSDAASAKVSALCDELCTLNVIEMNQLVSLFKEKVGLKGVDLMPQSAAPSAPVAAAPAASAPVKEEPKVAAKENFDVKLVSFSADDKIKVIKEVRAVTGLGLKEVSTHYSKMLILAFICQSLMCAMHFFCIRQRTSLRAPLK